MDDWDEFIESCADEEYARCSVIIDDETYKNVAIRAKGNTSLSSVQKDNGGNRRFPEGGMQMPGMNVPKQLFQMQTKTV